MSDKKENLERNFIDEIFFRLLEENLNDTNSRLNANLMRVVKIQDIIALKKQFEILIDENSRLKLQSKLH